MKKIALKKPVMFILYGFPGSGKSHFARQLSESLHVSLVSGERIRFELFEKPHYDKAEQGIVSHLSEYMSEEFLSAGLSVVLDVDTSKKAYRRKLRDLTRSKKAVPVLIWFQIDPDSAYARTKQRDRRTTEGKYARTFTKDEYNKFVNAMQYPEKDEDFVVLSGKHSFQMQKTAILRKLFDLGLIESSDLSAHVVKPGMINLVPANPEDGSRNINVR